jgi:hypothetical protein
LLLQTYEELQVLRALKETQDLRVYKERMDHKVLSDPMVLKETLEILAPRVLPGEQAHKGILLIG